MKRSKRFYFIAIGMSAIAVVSSLVIVCRCVFLSSSIGSVTIDAIGVGKSVDGELWFNFDFHGVLDEDYTIFLTALSGGQLCELAYSEWKEEVRGSKRSYRGKVFVLADHFGIPANIADLAANNGIGLDVSVKLYEEGDLLIYEMFDGEDSRNALGIRVERVQE